MKNVMSYRDYTGSVEYSKEDKVFHGKILGIRSLVTFEADTLEDLPKAFREMVDDYLNDCKEDGWEPEKPYHDTPKKPKPATQNSKSQIPRAHA